MLTWNKCNPNMDECIHTLWSMGWTYLSILRLQWLHIYLSPNIIYYLLFASANHVTMEGINVHFHRIIQTSYTKHHTGAVIQKDWYRYLPPLQNIYVLNHSSIIIHQNWVQIHLLLVCVHNTRIIMRSGWIYFNIFIIEICLFSKSWDILSLVWVSGGIFCFVCCVIRIIR